ncbi:MaoC family dehydratase N-terminal domain-containing protein [Paraburkholderia sp. CNPSo 3272]|uniref:FAS1-like dehydratase domain-containing protein n=1 Tax=Paraburkholderia sp. CNPSo 3272 TaxID=2940931 RepID=UPI0020B7F945|nr:MaoC family dehydratase N-terminal domain-containing protein [Paraburkholderia sp. CNPSo 3272]MCP3725752.1 MaoC family dehydratase N-terminal domain-containing protein [Paraburkholderia sp. CNPSo 3272]
MVIDIAHLQQWTGRTEEVRDQVTLTPMAALAAMLDRDDPPAAAGDDLPPLWHWLYFLPVHRQSMVGSDGHPKRGGFLPPVDLPRRMWAGSQLEFLRLLKAGSATTRLSRIESVAHKQGRTGDLVFVKVKHEVSDVDGVAIVEHQDVVYRDHPAASEKPAAPQAAPAGAQWAREVVPDPVLLFRYSALTLNGHRIHYDRPYAIGEEGYEGLVVHGPLLATLLMDSLRSKLPDARVRSFSFRAVKPVVDTTPFYVCGKRDESDPGKVILWISGSDGSLRMEASAVLA